jgi:hypothetical protein
MENGAAAPSLTYKLGKNSEVITKGDLIEVASGIAEALDDTAARPVGIANRTVTMASDNQTAAKVEIDMIPLNEDVVFEMDLDADATVANQGQFFTIAGATGAQVATFSTASAGVGQVQLVKLDPRGEGSVRRGLFRSALTGLAFEPET